MKERIYHIFEISDANWELIESQLIGQPRQHGGIIKCNQKLVDAIAWILKTGFSWSDLPPDYGK